jgi:hypothetical protein
VEDDIVVVATNDPSGASDFPLGHVAVQATARPAMVPRCDRLHPLLSLGNDWGGDDLRVRVNERRAGFFSLILEDKNILDAIQRRKRPIPVLIGTQQFPNPGLILVSQDPIVKRRFHEDFVSPPGRHVPEHSGPFRRPKLIGG